MQDFKSAAEALKDAVGLRGPPVAVKFFEQKPPLEEFGAARERRYCQALMGARRGRKLLLTAENVSCPAAAWALGLKPPPAKLSSGEMPAAMGIFGSPQAAKNTLDTMSRLEMGKYRAVALCPLSEAPFTPDVVVLESWVEHLMWVALAMTHETGGRLSFSTAILQATCVDVTVIPFLTQRMNASLGCYGCREATDMTEGEAVLGFPIKDLDTIAESLEALRARAMLRVRSKAVYNALLDIEGRPSVWEETLRPS